MRFLDRYLQTLRFRAASRHITDGDRVLDVGSDDGALFAYLGPRVGPGVGVDPNAETSTLGGRHRLIKGFVDDVDETDTFDCCTVLAVLEHLDDSELLHLGQQVAKRLTGNGIIVATVPSPMVDKILDVMIRMHLLDGMEAEQHHGVDVDHLPDVLAQAGWQVRSRTRFELGLNNLMVFER
jgi:SAM-dependent methyltransferase